MPVRWLVGVLPDTGSRCPDPTSASRPAGATSSGSGCARATVLRLIRWRGRLPLRLIPPSHRRCRPSSTVSSPVRPETSHPRLLPLRRAHPSACRPVSGPASDRKHLLPFSTMFPGIRSKVPAAPMRRCGGGREGGAEITSERRIRGGPFRERRQAKPTTRLRLQQHEHGVRGARCAPLRRPRSPDSSLSRPLRPCIVRTYTPRRREVIQSEPLRSNRLRVLSGAPALP